MIKKIEKILNDLEQQGLSVQENFFSSNLTHNLKPVTQITFQVEQDAQVLKLYKVKETAIQNLKDFIKTQQYPNSIWEDFFSSKQYLDLKPVDVEIDLENVGNPYPFYVEPPPEEEEGV